MQILIFIIIGLINGIFSSGAGQVLLFYFIYMKKIDSKIARYICLATMPIVSIPTCIIYMKKITIDIKRIVILVIVSIIFGILGNNVMKKSNSNYLNFFSGVILFGITIINLWRIL